MLMCYEPHPRRLQVVGMLRMGVVGTRVTSKKHRLDHRLLGKKRNVKNCKLISEIHQGIKRYCRTISTSTG